MNQTRELGAAIRLARETKGLTREEFSTISSANYLGEIERGEKRLTVEKLRDLADFIGVHPASLLVFVELTTSADTDLSENARRQSALDDADLESALDRIRSEVAELSASLTSPSKSRAK